MLCHMAVSRERAVLEGLGLRAPDALALAAKVQAGVHFSRVRAFLRRSGMTEAQLAVAASIAPRTWERRKADGRFAADESDRVARVVRLHDLARKLLGSPAAATEWLLAPSLALGEERPLHAARSEMGGREVERVLLALEEGVYL